MYRVTTEAIAEARRADQIRERLWRDPASLSVEDVELAAKQNLSIGERAGLGWVLDRIAR